MGPSYIFQAKLTRISFGYCVWTLLFSERPPQSVPHVVCARHYQIITTAQKAPSYLTTYDILHWVTENISQQKNRSPAWRNVTKGANDLPPSYPDMQCWDGTDAEGKLLVTPQHWLYGVEGESTTWYHVLDMLCLGMVWHLVFVAKCLPSTVPEHHIDRSLLTMTWWPALAAHSSYSLWYIPSVMYMRAWWPCTPTLRVIYLLSWYTYVRPRPWRRPRSSRRCRCDCISVHAMRHWMCNAKNKLPIHHNWNKNMHIYMDIYTYVCMRGCICLRRYVYEYKKNWNMYIYMYMFMYVYV